LFFLFEKIPNLVSVNLRNILRTLNK